jgi:hypothetical protein
VCEFSEAVAPLPDLPSLVDRNHGYDSPSAVLWVNRYSDLSRGSADDDSETPNDSLPDGGGDPQSKRPSGGTFRQSLHVLWEMHSCQRLPRSSSVGAESFRVPLRRGSPRSPGPSLIDGNSGIFVISFQLRMPVDDESSRIPVKSESSPSISNRREL